MISKEAENELTEALVSLGNSQHQTQINDETTHVVLGSNLRSLKTIVGIANGLHLVRKEWIEESRKANHWLDEDDFNVHDWFPGSKHSFLAHKQNNPSHLLFHSITFYICQNPVFPLPTLSKVLESLGGKILPNPNHVDICIENTSNPRIQLPQCFSLSSH